jgi:hypothetical protein
MAEAGGDEAAVALLHSASWISSISYPVRITGLQMYAQRNNPSALLPLDSVPISRKFLCSFKSKAILVTNETR